MTAEEFPLGYFMVAEKPASPVVMPAAEDVPPLRSPFLEASVGADEEVHERTTE